MSDLTISDMMKMSYDLYDQNKDSWSPMTPEYGKDFILYMIEEIGEVISVIKKKSTQEIMTEGPVRDHMVEELSDVLMYFIDTLNRYHISAEEFSNAYKSKYESNMKRDFKKDHESFIREESV
ncbi:nucleotide pyrophosphohydrolase [Acidaminobacter sp. JC074]|uniref:MazG-like family protein n=1 Tax=Acidaminobacter sp. JC074 TaxID=2530199 RepID=UPI001F0FB86C|nr:MazG-like family protein [Acidaminobacter sp. JC074]MCH4888005.1 nucleotide pyrophosphohydrolase [Acidaminobacter sp. JC074]